MVNVDTTLNGADPGHVDLPLLPTDIDLYCNPRPMCRPDAATCCTPSAMRRSSDFNPHPIRQSDAKECPPPTTDGHKSACNPAMMTCS